MHNKESNYTETNSLQKWECLKKRSECLVGRSVCALLFMSFKCFFAGRLFWQLGGIYCGARSER